MSELEILEARAHLPEAERALALITMQHADLSKAHEQLLKEVRQAIQAHYRPC